ncbi:hypothetical protein Cgig2_020243 [Carnegiea gigantea]|uniref:Uncharacterized protein n=1 Tax=Carnegiea gigantea TaxID=171969 RepID=A0A9Q1GGW7_9CARY|nr:hypothetical protein Cgig2_007578 [Carnegiea gigantea]KAJ8450606.1 hypothetical protein Cgig2_020243 [Carnegiea gigantea]
MFRRAKASLGRGNVHCALYNSEEMTRIEPNKYDTRKEIANIESVKHQVEDGRCEFQVSIQTSRCVKDTPILDRQPECNGHNNIEHEETSELQQLNTGSFENVPITISSNSQDSISATNLDASRAFEGTNIEVDCGSCSDMDFDGMSKRIVITQRRVACIEDTQAAKLEVEEMLHWGRSSYRA